eukprot:Skav227393  [mRNA]  locus=scaffold3215:126807:128498:- [translate_table: standard]
MVALTLEFSNLANHQASIFKQLQAFRKEGKLCDVVLKSRDGTEHTAHKAVLCAASIDVRNMLLGSFAEARQVQEGQPVQIAASDAVVSALLEYIYGGQLQVELEDSVELLRLADAYGFPKLKAMIEGSLCAALENGSVATALKFLRHAWDLRELSAKCEEKVATNFGTCIDMVDFLELSTGQLGRILRRDDLTVSREEVVVKGLFNWFKRSKDRGDGLGGLLQNIDFQCLSSSNLVRLRHLSASIGPVGHDLQREVEDALEVRQKRSAEGTPDAFRPKRHCLQHWSPYLGGRAQAPRRVLPRMGYMCWHRGAIYCASFAWVQPARILRWKPGDSESKAVAGRGARVNGVNDLGPNCKLSLCPEGRIFVVDFDNHRRLVSFENGTGTVVLTDANVRSVSCAPSGAIYVLTQGGAAVEKLVGKRLEPLISTENMPAELQFNACDLFVTKDEVIYLADMANSRVLRMKPGEAEPVVVGEAPNKERASLRCLFVTEEEKIFVSDRGQQKLWAFHPGDTVWTEVLAGPGMMHPISLLVQGRSLYASIDWQDGTAGVCEYSLPPELQLG